MTLGERIQYYRKAKGLMQAELGELLFVTRQTVSLWEKGQTQPSVDNLIRLSEIFGVTIDHLVGHDLAASKNLESESLISPGISESKPETDKAEIPAQKDISAPSAKEDAPLPPDEREKEDIEDSFDSDCEEKSVGNAEETLGKMCERSKKDNRCLQYIRNHKVFVSIILAAILSLAVASILIIRSANASGVSDSEIEEIIGASLPDYESRVVTCQQRKRKERGIRAITEICFEGDVSEVLSLSMISDAPSGIDKAISSSFLYKDSELYAMYDLKRGAHVSSFGEDGGYYAFLSYDADLHILRIIEFYF